MYHKKKVICLCILFSYLSSPISISLAVLHYICVGFSATCHINFSQPSLYHWILELYHHHVRANILEFPTLYLSFIWRPLPSWPSHVDIRSQSRKTPGTYCGNTIEFSIHRLSGFSYPWSVFSSSWLLASSSCIYSFWEPSSSVFPLELAWGPEARCTWLVSLERTQWSCTLRVWDQVNAQWLDSKGIWTTAHAPSYFRSLCRLLRIPRERSLLLGRT